MQFLSTKAVFLLLGVASASPQIFQRAACNANNCYRAVAASSKTPPGPTVAKQDCSTYLAKTTTTCFTRTVVVPTPATTPITACPAPAVTNQGTAFPTYASACSSFAAYSSACSCNGVTSASSTTSYTATLVSQTTAGCPTATAFLLQAVGGTYNGQYLRNEPAYPERLVSDITLADFFTLDSSTGHAQLSGSSYYLSEFTRFGFFFVQGRVLEVSQFEDGSSRQGLSCQLSNGVTVGSSFTCTTGDGSNTFFVCPSYAAQYSQDPESIYFAPASGAPAGDCVPISFQALPVC